MHKELILYYIISQRLQRTTANRWPNSCGNWCNNSKMASTTEFLLTNVSWTTFQRPILRQTCIVKGHSEQIWARSSYRPSQLTQLVGHCTPLSWSRTRVDKHSRHIFQIKFFTFDGTFSLQIPDQSPSLQRWEASTNVFFTKIVALSTSTLNSLPQKKHRH